jgi:hypothetical protein
VQQITVWNEVAARMWVANDGKILLACVIAMKNFHTRVAKTRTSRRRETIKKKVNFVSPEGCCVSSSELFCYPLVNRKLFSCAHFVQLAFNDDSEFKFVAF